MEKAISAKLPKMYIKADGELTLGLDYPIGDTGYKYSDWKRLTPSERARILKVKGNSCVIGNLFEISVKYSLGLLPLRSKAGSCDIYHMDVDGKARNIEIKQAASGTDSCKGNSLVIYCLYPTMTFTKEGYINVDILDNIFVMPKATFLKIMHSVPGAMKTGNKIQTVWSWQQSKLKKDNGKYGYLNSPTLEANLLKAFRHDPKVMTYQKWKASL